MPTVKRPYVPKVKGCHQCSRRRIHCDRTDPECKKCFAKGIRCTGLGIRLRFCFGCEPDDVRRKHSTRDDGSLMWTPNFSSNNIDDTTTTGEIDLSDAASRPITEQWSFESNYDVSSFLLANDPPVDSEANFLPCLNDPETAIDDGINTFTAIRSPTVSNVLYRPVPDELPPWQNDLCLYFSQHICPNMISIDGIHNGWRTLVLPIARKDKLVRDAVLSVSAFHIRQNRFPATETVCSGAPKSDYFIPDANQLYGGVIRGLQQQPELDSCDVERRDSILITILVLLLGAMVNGASDYPILFRMIESALHANGGDGTLGTGDVATFIDLQFSKIKVYGAPLRDENSAVEIFSSQEYVAKLFNCLCQRASQFPEHSISFALITDLVQQAMAIYIGGVQRNQHSGSSTDMDIAISIARVHHFNETLELFSPETPGDHIIIWAVFVAAASCILDKDMEFFEQMFMRHFLRSGFANLLSGLELLRKIWKRKPGDKWTTSVNDMTGSACFTRSKVALRSNMLH
ncbi:hypothetical protein FSARC_8784 [Fusarium sarcochroum]|uniref:Zn(2)-C6 fungal-type domain-containing protein n=1 Tax=Fusarium sarcochroum TaxID=1208366 RepID=A0A8H4TSD7_9HYPO|nr:hypothetical protein FSARC_8784 [Fusarium sarcochroum]